MVTSYSAFTALALFSASIEEMRLRCTPIQITSTLKRVIGLPGDVLVSTDDVLTINGVVYDAVPGTGNWTATVSAGTIFCLGDNRSNSHDSRDFGSIPISQIFSVII